MIRTGTPGHNVLSDPSTAAHNTLSAMYPDTSKGKMLLDFQGKIVMMAAGHLLAKQSLMQMSKNFYLMLRLQPKRGDRRDHQLCGMRR